MKKGGRKLLRPYHDLLHILVGRCPHCGPSMAGGAGSRTVIYRMSNRAVTFRCEDCSLQWTMTYHRISRMAGRYAPTLPEGSAGRQLHDQAARAFQMDETRGRRRREQ